MLKYAWNKHLKRKMYLLHRKANYSVFVICVLLGLILPGETITNVIGSVYSIVLVKGSAAVEG